MAVHRAVLLGCGIAVLAACSQQPTTGKAIRACLPPGEDPGSSGTIVGGLRYVLTIGPVTAPGPTWESGTPRAGVGEIHGDGERVAIKLPTQPDGSFRCRVPSGRYRVVGFIPGVLEDGDGPVIVASKSVVAGAGKGARVHLLVFERRP
jgi:hypothetical protein